MSQLEGYIVCMMYGNRHDYKGIRTKSNGSLTKVISVTSN